MLGIKPYAEGGIVGAPKQPIDGGIMTRPHVGFASENGTEEISKVISRNAPEQMITDSAPTTATTAGGGMFSIPVTIENVTFDVAISGGEARDENALVETIKENVRNLTDEIAYRLALSIEQTWANVPLAAQGR
jgi:hypothetical protein